MQIRDRETDIALCRHLILRVSGEMPLIPGRVKLVKRRPKNGTETEKRDQALEEVREAQDSLDQ